MSVITKRPRERVPQLWPAKVKSVAEESHEVEAVVAVFGNVDSYGDRLIKGCFAKSLQQWEESGDRIPFVWSHLWEDPDAFIGEVLHAEETDEGLLVRAHVDTEGELAARVWALLKARRIKEFSFAFDYVEVLETDEIDDWGWPVRDVYEVELYETGPCFKGANPATQLIETRARNRRRMKDAIAAHSTETDDGEWDGAANEARLANEDGADVYRAAFAWVDPDGDPDTKAAYRFVHHFVSEDGTPGAASSVACSAGIGVLNGARGGTTIPDEDREGVYNHLARHLRDADMEPPELQERSDEPERKELGDQVDGDWSNELREHMETLLGASDALSKFLRDTLGTTDQNGMGDEEDEEELTAEPKAQKLAELERLLQ